MLLPLADTWEIAAGSFGITAALLLVGGWVLLRYQRDRHHFLLTQAALEKGLTALPNGLPVWVVSLRQGIMVLFLGLGLLAAGAGTCLAAHLLPGPPDAATRPVPLPGPAPQEPAAAPHPEGPSSREPRPPEGPRFMPNPELDQWRRMENIQVAGLATMGVGGIISLLGVVRIAFARAEKKYLNP